MNHRDSRNRVFTPIIVSASADLTASVNGHGLMEIWDLHCHLSGVPGDTPEARLGKMIEYADRMGIARLCVFMGMQWSYDPSPEKLRQDNDEILRALRQYPGRAFGFVYLNPTHTQSSLDELN